MPLLNDVIHWCKQERERLRQQLKLLTDAQAQDAKSAGLPKTLASIKERVAELDALIAQHHG